MDHHSMLFRRSICLSLVVALLVGLVGTGSFGMSEAMASEATSKVETFTWGGAAIVSSISSSESDAASVEDIMNQIISKNEASLKQGLEAKANTSAYSNLLTSKVSDALNVRAKASQSSSIVGKLYKGCKATILKKNGNWYKIKSGVVTGWVLGKYVYTGEKANSYLNKLNPRTATVKYDKVNVRKTAKKSGTLLLSVYKNNSFMVIKTKGNWVKVRITPTVSGWIQKDLVTIKHQAGKAISAKKIKTYTNRIAKLEKERKEEAAKKAAAKKAAAKKKAAKKKAAAKKKSSSKKSSTKKTTKTTKRSKTKATESDATILAAICQHEAGSNYKGCLAVANVVLNRKRSSRFPNTIKGVIFQRNQFCSYSTLKRVIKRGLSRNAKKAAKDALNGKNNVGSRLSFRSARTGVRRKNSIVIGGNVFF